MVKPERPLLWSESRLPYHLMGLLRRVHSYMRDQHPERIAAIVFDSQDHGTDLKMTSAFESFLYRVPEGKAWQNILPSPLFVDSRGMPGIQIADAFVSCVRQYHELTEKVRNAKRGPAGVDGTVDRGYYTAIGRLHQQVGRTVWDSASDEEGKTYYGEYILSAWPTGSMVPDPASDEPDVPNARDVPHPPE